MGESTDYRPLEGIKMVGLSTMVAIGSYGRMLADWGAEVIRVESVGGDMSRNFPKAFSVPCTMDENPLFDSLSTGKRGIVLNLKTLGRMDAMHRLLTDADIFLTNTGPKVLERLGLDYAPLKKAYPRLAMANISGFEEKGLRKSNPRSGTVVFWAGSGFNADTIVNGPDNYPVYSSAGPGDAVTVVGLCCAITTAFYKRNRTGLGNHVSSSLYGTALWCFRIMVIAAEKQYGYTYLKTRKNSVLTGAPLRAEGNEWVMTTILQMEKQWPILCNALGVLELGTDPRYNTAIKQRDPEVRKYLVKCFEEIYKAKTTNE